MTLLLEIPSPPAALANRDAPTRRDYIIIGAGALALRIIVFLAVAWRLHLNAGEYAHLYDGPSYLATAKAMTGDYSEFSDYHGRVFPGFPAMIALLHTSGIPWDAAALGINWFCAAAAAMMAAALFNDRRIGWAMASLIPHYLMNSSMALSEAPMLALMMLGLLLTRRAAIGGGIALGLSMLVRPMACFATLGALRWWWDRPRLKNAAQLAAAAALTLGGGVLLMQHWRGDALAGVRFYATSPGAYGGHLFAWPFQSLLVTPFQIGEPASRIAYIWAHAALALLACVLLLSKGNHAEIQAKPLNAMCVPWLLGNTAFALCIGSIWGFECFHRFLIPALPALFWALRRFLPRRGWVFLIIAIVSAIIASLSVGRVLYAH